MNSSYWVVLILLPSCLPHHFVGHGGPRPPQGSRTLRGNNKSPSTSILLPIVGSHKTFFCKGMTRPKMWCWRFICFLRPSLGRLNLPDLVNINWVNDPHEETDTWVWSPSPVNKDQKMIWIQTFLLPRRDTITTETETIQPTVIVHPGTN